MWELVDPDGRHVVLSRVRWAHIVEEHDELRVEPGVVLATVSHPDRRTRGHEIGEEWFYRRGAGPSRWLKVVVHYERDRGAGS